MIVNVVGAVEGEHDPEPQVGSTKAHADCKTDHPGMHSVLVIVIAWTSLTLNW
jgi:hypothetical protein